MCTGTHISAALACGAERWGIIGFDTDARSAGWLDQMVAATTAVFALVRYVTASQCCVATATHASENCVVRVRVGGR